MSMRFISLGVGLGLAAAFVACSGASDVGDGDDGSEPKTNRDKIEAYCDELCKCEGACPGSGDDGDDGDGIEISGGNSDGDDYCVSSLEGLLDSTEETSCPIDAAADFYACLAKDGTCTDGYDGYGGNYPSDDGGGYQTLYDAGCVEEYSKALGACGNASSSTGTTSGSGICEDPLYPISCGPGDRCVPQSYVCDGSSDCIDGRDEIGCGCDVNEYSCYDGSCVPQSYVCDGGSDCSSGEDEVGCCTAPNFNCGTGDYCLSQSSVCDGYNDCINGYDELGCSCDPDTEATCANGACIPASYVCDGSPDCSEGEDELPENCP